jgi:hypothetical protein
MPRRVKLDFEPLTLEETAKRLQIPQSRAKKILTLVGVDPQTLSADPALRKKRARIYHRSVKVSAAK